MPSHQKDQSKDEEVRGDRDFLRILLTRLSQTRPHDTYQVCHDEVVDVRITEKYFGIRLLKDLKIRGRLGQLSGRRGEIVDLFVLGWHAARVFVKTDNFSRADFRALKTEELRNFVFVDDICANAFFQEMTKLAIECVELLFISLGLFVQKPCV